MGACLGRDRKEEINQTAESIQVSPVLSIDPNIEQNGHQVPGSVLESSESWVQVSTSGTEQEPVRKEHITRQHIDKLVLKTLDVIRLLVDK